MHFLVTTALATVLLTTSAYAQSTQRNQPQAQTQATQPAKLQFINEQKPSEWSAEALIGRTVYNMQDESLGDINNVILSEDGRVTAVTVGVGGFLGIGEKNVGVPFSSLEFRGERPAASGTTAVQPRNETSQQPRAEQNPNGRMSGQQQAAPGRQQATRDQNRDAQNRDAMNLRWDSEHRNVRIYLNATKQQLESAPEFAWLGEEGGADQNRQNRTGQQAR